MALRRGLRKVGCGVGLLLALEGLVRVTEGLSGHVSSNPLIAVPISTRSEAAKRRTLAPDSTVRFAERDGDIEYRANALGSRGAGPSDAQRRVVVLGDSIAFGLGVQEDETFPAQLESLLEGALSKRAESVAVLNLAIPGYDLLDSEEALQQDGMPWRPTDVIVQVTHNDLAPRLRGPSTKLGIGARLQRLAMFTLHSSALGRRVRQAAGALGGRLPGDPPRWPEARALAYLEFWRRSATEGSPAFTTSLARVRALIEQARAAGADVVVLWIPLEAEAFDSRPDPIGHRLAELARGAGAAFVDATAAVHPATGSLTLDGLHPSPEGHRALADLLHVSLDE